jgi:DNA repair protein RadD
MLNRIFPFFFGNIAYKIETQELIDRGYLSPIVYHTEDTDWDELKINTTGADFTTDALEKFWNNKRLAKLAEIIEHINYSHELNLIFCSSIRQAERTKELMEEKGMDCAIVTSQTPAKERDEIVQRFRDGKLKHLINVNCFSVGLDIPELDSIVLARPTMSLALYYQQVGRGVRLNPNNPDKKLHVYDVAGVVERMGRVETVRLAKEGGWKDKVVSEVGDMSGRPLFSFKVKRDIFHKKTKSKELTKASSGEQLSLL